MVPDVEARPGHIACDAATKSELVLPILVDGIGVGVLDLDCTSAPSTRAAAADPHAELDGFTDADVHGLQRVLEVVVSAVAWPEALHR